MIVNSDVVSPWSFSTCSYVVHFCCLYGAISICIHIELASLSAELVYFCCCYSLLEIVGNGIGGPIVVIMKWVDDSLGFDELRNLILSSDTLIISQLLNS